MGKNNKLTLIIEHAIKEEEYAFHLYTDMAEETTVESIKRLLTNLAEQEATHKEKLQTLNLGNIRMLPAVISRIDVAEELALTPLDEFKSLEDAFKFAVIAEIRANEMYITLGKAAESPDAKKIFTLLAEEEAQHKATLLTTMHDLGLS